MFDQGPSEEGGGGDDFHDSNRMFELLKAAHKKWVELGGESGLCRSCASINFSALLFTELLLWLDEEDRERAMKLWSEKVSDWVKSNEEAGLTGDADTLIFHV